MLKRKFNLRNVVAIAICLTGITIFSGCTKNDPNDPNNPPATVMQSAKVSGTVLDISGNPLSGVSVSTGTENATTGGDGTFTFSKAGTVNDRAVFKLEKAGYFPLTRSALIDSIGEIAMQAMMYRKGTTSGVSLQTDFDAGSAQTLLVGGMSVSLPAGSVVKADGSAYSGTVHADILYLAPDNANASLLMPGGDLITGTAKNSADMLLPYGITDVELTDGAGNPLEVKKDAGVEIAFPVPAGATDASISHWTFNEGYGVWVEEGTLTKQGNVYKGAVNHFTTHGSGNKRKYVTVQTEVLACDKPKGGVPVTVTANVGFDAALAPLIPLLQNFKGITNSAGYCSFRIPNNDIKYADSYTVTATYNGKTQSQNLSTTSYFGLQAVVLNFNDGCPGNITFNLKAGLNSYSFIVECVPAMPEPPVGLTRKDPLYYFKPAEEINYVKLGGAQNTDYLFIFPVGNINRGSWNTDFTEFTYTCRLGINPDGNWWGTMTLNTAAALYGTAYMKSYNINSITIGKNDPVSISNVPNLN
jgi:hypothetical protein